jgi:hypothetical protein
LLNFCDRTPKRSDRSAIELLLSLILQLFLFWKMDAARSMIVMPCCYHKMSVVDGKVKYFPLSEAVKAAVEKTGSAGLMNIPFLRLASHSPTKRDLYELVFDLMVRGILQLYAHIRKCSWLLHHYYILFTFKKKF